MTRPAPIVLVDGFNLLHARVLRGRDRRDWNGAEARARLITALEHAVVPPGAEVVVVFDDPRPATPGTTPRVVHAPDADAWITDQVLSHPDPETVTVVTADRALGDRCRTAGAHVVRPHAFLPRRP